MERRIVKKLGGMKEENLLRLVRRSGILSLEASREILRRLREGKLKTDGEYLRTILKNVKTAGKLGKGATELKNEVAIIMIEKGTLDKRDFVIILRQIDTQKILKRAIRKYLAENKDIPNYLLVDMIRRIKLLTLKERLTKRLFDQNPSTDDLLVIIEELEGSPLQIEAVKKLFEIGIESEDFCYLAGFTESPLVAREIWKTGKEKDIIEKLSIEDTYEISKYTDSPMIKRETLNEMLLKKEDLTEEQLKYVRDNADLITIEEPEKVREWIEEELLSLPLNFDEVIRLEEEIKSPSLKLRMKRKALILMETEIEEMEEEKKEYPYLYDKLDGWRNNRLKYLKEKRRELKREISILQKKLQESIKVKDEAIELHTVPQT